MENTQNDKQLWEEKIISLGLGQDDDLVNLDVETLKVMFTELKVAQDNGELNLETATGVDNLERIINKYEI